MNLATLSAARLESRYERLNERQNAICHKLIAAGYGNERGSETRARAAETGDKLALEYVDASDARQAVIDEMNRRRAWHGSLRPIRKGVTA